MAGSLVTVVTVSRAGGTGPFPSREFACPSPLEEAARMPDLSLDLHVEAPAELVWDVVRRRFHRIGEWATASLRLLACPPGRLRCSHPRVQPVRRWRSRRSWRARLRDRLPAATAGDGIARGVRPPGPHRPRASVVVRTRASGQRRWPGEPRQCGPDTASNPIVDSARLS